MSPFKYITYKPKLRNDIFPVYHCCFESLKKVVLILSSNVTHRIYKVVFYFLNFIMLQTFL